MRSIDAQCRTQPADSVDLLAKPRATGRCEARDAVLTERRRRCAHPGPILPYSGAVMSLGRPCVFGAVQVAPTPRIRPREVPRHGGSEADGASKSRPSNLKLALVADRYGSALYAESSRQIRHIADGKRAPGCSQVALKHRVASAGLIATAGELASCTLLMPCIWDAHLPQACVRNAASAGTSVSHHGDRCDLSEVAAPGWRPLAACSNAPDASCISADPLTQGRRGVRVRPR